MAGSFIFTRRLYLAERRPPMEVLYSLADVRNSGSSPFCCKTGMLHERVCFCSVIAMKPRSIWCETDTVETHLTVHKGGMSHV